MTLSRVLSQPKTDSLKRKEAVAQTKKRIIKKREAQRKHTKVSQ